MRAPSWMIALTRGVRVLLENRSLLVAIPHDLFSRSLHDAVVVRAGRRESPSMPQPTPMAHDGALRPVVSRERELPHNALSGRYIFSSAFSFKYFVYVLWFLMLKHFYGTFPSVSSYPIFFFFFNLVVSGQQRPNPAHLPFGVVLSKTAFLGASGTGCVVCNK